MVSSDKMSHSLHRTQKEIGCEFCSLDENPGIRKVHGEVNGREVFIWGMAPGREENKEELEFVGKSGRLLWQELELVGIKRPMCDIQNVVRCFPTKKDSWPALKMRNPSKDEVHCCSKFTNIAIEKSKAKVHIIFGVLAAKTLLGGEYRKGKKPFWSEKLRGQVLCMWHPSYLVRNGCSAGGTQKPNEKLKRWRQDFESAVSLLGGKNRYRARSAGRFRE
jgi:uracil-DNA glycosylase family 4